MKKLLRNMRIYIPMLVATGVASVIAFIICHLIDRIAGNHSHFLLTGGFFAIFFILLGTAVFFCEYICESLPETSLRSHFRNPITRRSTAIFVVCVLLGSFLAGGILQVLYELEPARKATNVEAYAFILDNSGSMDDNDPDNKRFEALTQICATLPIDKPVAVYIFGTDTRCMRPYATQEQQPIVLNESWYEDLGGTSLGHAIDVCCQDTEQARTDGIFSGAVRIIDLTDGDSPDLGWFFGKSIDAYVNEAIDSGCEIFSIGFGSPNRSTLQDLSWGTGGEYYDAGDAYNIAATMQTAVKAKSRGRMLMGVRAGRKASSFGYGLLRFLFVGILGFGVSCCAAMMIDNKKITQILVVQTGVKSIVAALLLELLIQHSFGSGFVQLITCLLIGTLVLETGTTKSEHSRCRYRDYSDGTLEGSKSRDSDWNTLSVQDKNKSVNAGDYSVKG